MNAGATSTRIDLNLFRVFDTVFRAGSLTQAAALLYLSQPAVSNALARLRAHFDDPLFVRDGRRMVPTARAREIAPSVKAALGALGSTLRREPERYEPGADSRRYTVAMVPAIELVWLPLIHESLRDHAPGIRLLVTRLERSKLASELATGKLDLAIDIALPLTKDIARRPLSPQRLCVALRADPRRGRRKLSLEDWLALDHIVVSARSSGMVAEDLDLQAQGLERRVVLRCQSFESASQIVANSDLAATLPYEYARRVATGMGLQLHELPLPVKSLDVMLYWHVSTEDDPGMRWLRGQVLTAAPAERGVARRRSPQS